MGCNISQCLVYNIHKVKFFPAGGYMAGKCIYIRGYVRKVLGMRGRLSRVLALMLCLMMYCTAAMAEKIDYKDSRYNFKNIKSILIYDMDFSNVDLGSSIMEKNLQSVYENKSSDSKLAVLEDEQILRKISLGTGQDMDLLAEKDNDAYEKMYWEHMPDYVDAYVMGEVLTYEPRYVHHDAYTTWETRTEHVRMKDSEGYWQTVEVSHEEPVYHPDYYTVEFDVVVEFHVYDSKTGKEIFSRRDVRSRDDNEGKDMYARICGNFFSDFGKLTR